MPFVYTSWIRDFNAGSVSLRDADTVWETIETAGSRFLIVFNDCRPSVVGF